MNIDIKTLYKNAVVVIDTCCLVENIKGCQKFFINSVPYLKETGSRIQIAYKCIQELYKIRNDVSLPEIKRKSAEEAIEAINIMANEGLLDVRGQESDSFGDSIILQNLIRYFVRYNVVLITQDRGLASDAQCINNFISVKSRKRKKIIVKNLDRNGDIIDIIPKKKENCVW
ncbi:MAG: hypothetical protein K2I00_01495 [Ruminococcus sp.]|nr:hypothetical protein [Ruminococcus sp.]